MAAPQTQRSFADVLQDIVANFQQMIRAEFKLVKFEIRDKANQAARPAGVFASGSVLAFYGLGFVFLAIVYALALVIPQWAAALTVGAILSLVGAALVAAGRKRLGKINPAPDRTVATLKENVQWAKGQIK
jgi:Putative Actinobacterial Holin-X, holin superfamily III